MAEFHLTVAGHTGAVSSLFESTPVYLRDYITREPAEFSVTLTDEALRFEDRQLQQEALEEGFRPRVFTEHFLERTAIQRAFAEHLFNKDTLLLHGSAIAVDGRAYLFTAKSGTGKSTHTRLWRELLGQRAVMINDDKPFITLHGGTATVHGAPWSGKHGLDANISLPLRGICLLERSKENAVAPATAETLLPILRHGAYRPLDPAQEARFLELTELLAAAAPLWRMGCRPDLDAARLAFEALHRE